MENNSYPNNFLIQPKMSQNIKFFLSFNNKEIKNPKNLVNNTTFIKSMLKKIILINIPNIQDNIIEYLNYDNIYFKVFCK